jgi:BMFP domain-containing protein YqiC
MSKKPPKVDAAETFGSDSFLDIIANMVGILIILVMVVGLRVKNAVEVEAPVAEIVNPNAQAEAMAKQAAGLEEDSLKLVDNAKQLAALASRKYDERGELQLLVKAKEAALEEEKAKLASGSREAFDVQQAYLIEQSKLAQLEAEINALVYAPQKDVIKIKTYPTPISRAVSGREVHFQIKGGRITLVPLDQLIDELKRTMQGQLSKLRDRTEITETVGPIGGYRMRYTLERIDVAGQVNGNSMTPGGSIVRTTFFEVFPDMPDQGEKLADAMRRGSQFQNALADIDPRRYTVTLWAYPESFEHYRLVREHLYQRGFTVAGRPLPDGQLISGSPHGSKSAAQ